MSTYLCPRCKGDGMIDCDSSLSGLRGDAMECPNCGGKGSIGAPEGEICGFRCPFCGTSHAPRGDCHDGADIACCGEVGHCEPIYRESNDENV